MSEPGQEFFQELYAGFAAPIQELDCGKKCAPYNVRGVPFCCDTAHTVPSAYEAEWVYLQANTNLWHLWQADDPAESTRLKNLAPAGQVLIACQGHARCQRDYRALTCRSFPFFPYLTSGGDFIGLSVYGEYEDRCWVISNLDSVKPDYLDRFITTYGRLFERIPRERTEFAHHAAEMRKTYAARRRSIPLLHRNGASYKISPRSERLRRVSRDAFPQFGPYKLAQDLPFPDEIASA